MKIAHAPLPLSRREAIRKMAVAMGATIVGNRLLAADFGADSLAGDYSAADIRLLDEIGDTIIPPTDVPGAKAVGIGEFIAMMVRDCQPPEEAAVFKRSLDAFAADYERRRGESFVVSPPVSRLDHLDALNRGLGDGSTLDDRKLVDLLPFFRTVKQLTILGYFTSEIGCTQALRYIETPGRYDGAADYKPGDRAWFERVR